MLKKAVKSKLIYGLLALVLALLVYVALPRQSSVTEAPSSDTLTVETAEDVLKVVPEYSSQAYVVINDNEPFFDIGDYEPTSFEQYGELDESGRCTYAFACIGTDIMPTKKRGSISHIYPTGWEQAKYDCVYGKSLYNRCHLIGYQLSAENANKANLITGTRYMNTEGMLPFENVVADYVKETDNHVLYRVTPIFEGDNLVASGVLMEAKSMEDKGEGICFSVYCYNVQPGVVIDYATGKSKLE